MTLKTEIEKVTQKVTLTVRDWVAVIMLLYTPLAWAVNKAVEINGDVKQVLVVIQVWEKRLEQVEKVVATIQSEAKKPVPPER